MCSIEQSAMFLSYDGFGFYFLVFIMAMSTKGATVGDTIVQQLWRSPRGPQGVTCFEVSIFFSC